MTFFPMLCESAPATDETVEAMTGTHYFERKWDGIRAVVAVMGSKVTITNRNGVDITHRYPDLVEKFSMMGKNTKLILDGEILCKDDNGNYDFPLVHRRDAQSDGPKIAALSKSCPATFMAFDVLYDQIDLREQEYAVRNHHLNNLRRDHDEFVSWPCMANGKDALKLARQNGWEGLVAKRINSQYKSGRNSAWKKIKPVKSGSFIVLGLEPGLGARSDTFGAVYIGLKDGDTYKRVAKVGSGFKDRDLHDMVEAWEKVKDGTGEPPIVEVEYQEITKDGSLRFPVFKGFRSDVLESDCTPQMQMPS